MDERLRQLPSVYSLPEFIEAKTGEEVISVSETVSKAAAIYEKVRNTLEYEEEHLLRRNAIKRVVKRRLGVDVDAKELSKDLLTELIWARYLPNDKVPVRMIDRVAKVLLKYEELIAAANTTKDPSKTFAWLLDLIATEVESLLVPPSREDALASFMFRVIQERIEWTKRSLPKDQRELQLFLAVHRTLLKADKSRLQARVFNLYYPTWQKEPSENDVAKIVNDLDSIMENVTAQVNHSISEPLSRELRKYAVIFNVLFDVVEENPNGFLKLVQEKEQFKKAVAKSAKKRVKRFKTRLSRLVLRAVAFLFITKFLLALAIELPYDLLIAHQTTMLPLIINVLFPPTLLTLIGMFIRIPERKNMQNILKGVSSIVYNTEDLKIIFKVKPPRKGTLAAIMNILYVASFLFSYGVVAWFLVLLDFNVVSIAIFLLFLSLVTFFGIRIRSSKREVVVYTGEVRVIGTFIDVFTLPIIRVGRWISLKTPKVNVFLFFMDFIIEAPFKMAIEVIESWLAFVKEKKEEI